MTVSELIHFSEFGACVMALARKHGIRSQIGVVRALGGVGYHVAERTFANYLYGRTVVDPALPVALVSALNLNKGETKRLAWEYTFGQPPRGAGTYARYSQVG